MFGCLLMLPSIILADEHKGAKHVLFGTLVVGLFFTVQAGLYVISLKLDRNALEDLRWQFFPIAMQAANEFAPWGSSPGSFWFVFPQYDGFLTGHVIVNHAHNDYLELWLEMRWLFALAAFAGLVAFFWHGVRIWFRSEGFRSESSLLAQSAWIGLLLLLLHSGVDYPLRTNALLAVAGLLAAFLYREQKAIKPPLASE
jgi:O-antigen ligase